MKGNCKSSFRKLVKRGCCIGLCAVLGFQNPIGFLGGASKVEAKSIQTWINELNSAKTREDALSIYCEICEWNFSIFEERIDDLIFYHDQMIERVNKWGSAATNSQTEQETCSDVVSKINKWKSTFNNIRMNVDTSTLNNMRLNNFENLDDTLLILQSEIAGVVSEEYLLLQNIEKSYKTSSDIYILVKDLFEYSESKSQSTHAAYSDVRDAEEVLNSWQPTISKITVKFSSASTYVHAVEEDDWVHELTKTFTTTESIIPSRIISTRAANGKDISGWKCEETGVSYPHMGGFVLKENSTLIPIFEEETPAPATLSPVITEAPVETWLVSINAGSNKFLNKITGTQMSTYDVNIKKGDALYLSNYIDDSSMSNSLLGDVVGWKIDGDSRIYKVTDAIPVNGNIFIKPVYTSDLPTQAPVNTPTQAPVITEVPTNTPTVTEAPIIMPTQTPEEFWIVSLSSDINGFYNKITGTYQNSYDVKVKRGKTIRLDEYIDDSGIDDSFYGKVIGWRVTGNTTIYSLSDEIPVNGDVWIKPVYEREIASTDEPAKTEEPVATKVPSSQIPVVTVEPTISTNPFGTPNESYAPIPTDNSVKPVFTEKPSEVVVPIPTSKYTEAPSTTLTPVEEINPTVAPVEETNKPSISPGTSLGGEVTPTKKPNGNTVDVPVVTVAPTPVPTKNPGSIKCSFKKVTLGKGEKINLNVSNIKGRKVVYTSSNSYVSVSNKGVITAKSNGTSEIYIICDGKKLTVKITVKPAPKKIKFSNKRITLKKDQSKKLTLYITKGSASYKIKWSSSNSKVVKVSNGKVTAKKKGSAVITAKTFNGKVAKIQITVK